MSEQKMVSRKFICMSILLFDTLIILIALYLGIAEGHMTKYFGERRLITLLSCSQLLMISFLSFLIFEKRNEKFSLQIFKSPYFIWLIMSCGFIFLALDELLMIHEKTDKLIHQLLKINETAITDRIDDVIIVFYGIIGLYVLYHYRNEMKNFTYSIAYFIVGFILLFIMNGFDIITDTNEIAFISSCYYTWLCVAEESLKIFSEGIFAAGFYTCFLIASDKLITRPKAIGYRTLKEAYSESNGIIAATASTALKD